MYTYIHLMSVLVLCCDFVASYLPWLFSLCHDDSLFLSLLKRLAW